MDLESDPSDFMDPRYARYARELNRKYNTYNKYNITNEPPKPVHVHHVIEHWTCSCKRPMNTFDAVAFKCSCGTYWFKPEAKQRNDEMVAKIKKLEAENAALKARVEQLEAAEAAEFGDARSTDTVEV